LGVGILEVSLHPLRLLLNLDGMIDIAKFSNMVTLNLHFLKFKDMIEKIKKDKG
jgi:hypothetical protein